MPVTSTAPAWPESMTKTIACGCNKGCKKICSCMKKNVSCYIGCRCQEPVENCSRIQNAEAVFSDSMDSHNDYENDLKIYVTDSDND